MQPWPLSPGGASAMTGVGRWLHLVETAGRWIIPRWLCRRVRCGVKWRPMTRTKASVHQGVPGFAVGVLPAPGSILPVHARRSCAPRNLLRWTVPLHMRPGTAALRQAFVVRAGVVALFPPRAYGGVICVLPYLLRPP